MLMALYNYITHFTLLHYCYKKLYLSVCLFVSINSKLKYECLIDYDSLVSGSCFC